MVRTASSRTSYLASVRLNVYMEHIAPFCRCPYEAYLKDALYECHYKVHRLMETCVLHAVGVFRFHKDVQFECEYHVACDSRHVYSIWTRHVLFWIAANSTNGYIDENVTSKSSMFIQPGFLPSDNDRMSQYSQSTRRSRKSDFALWFTEAHI